jgi:hypothetical protein
MRRMRTPWPNSAEQAFESFRGVRKGGMEVEWRTCVSFTSKRTGVTNSHGSPSICGSRKVSTYWAMSIQQRRASFVRRKRPNARRRNWSIREAPIGDCLSPGLPRGFSFRGRSVCSAPPPCCDARAALLSQAVCPPSECVRRPPIQGRHGRCG